MKLVLPVSLSNTSIVATRLVIVRSGGLIKCTFPRISARLSVSYESLSRARPAWRFISRSN